MLRCSQTTLPEEMIGLETISEYFVRLSRNGQSTNMVELARGICGHYPSAEEQISVCRLTNDMLTALMEKYEENLPEVIISHDHKSIMEVYETLVQEAPQGVRRAHIRGMLRGDGWFRMVTCDVEKIEKTLDELIKKEILRQFEDLYGIKRVLRTGRRYRHNVIANPSQNLKRMSYLFSRYMRVWKCLVKSRPVDDGSPEPDLLEKDWVEYIPILEPAKTPEVVVEVEPLTTIGVSIIFKEEADMSDSTKKKWAIVLLSSFEPIFRELMRRSKDGQERTSKLGLVDWMVTELKMPRPSALAKICSMIQKGGAIQGVSNPNRERDTYILPNKDVAFESKEIKKIEEIQPQERIIEYDPANPPTVRIEADGIVYIFRPKGMGS